MDFDQGKLLNTIGGNGKNNIRMRQEFVDNEKPVFKEGSRGKGLLMDGDTWLDLDKIGIYQRAESFSIGIEVFVPKDLETGVIFHKMNSPELHSFRGYHLKIKDNKLEALLAHVWPDNALVVESVEEIPKEKWVQLTLTYNGTSKADGVSIYMDGKKLQTKTLYDNLYKDIIFHGLQLYENSPIIEPGLRIGAVWRGKGIGGAVVDNLMVFEKELTPVEVLQISNKEQLSTLKKKSYANLTADEKSELKEYYISVNSRSYKKAIEALEKDRLVLADSMDNVKQIMVMKESKQKRQSYLLARGQYDQPTDSVFPNTPEAIFPFSDKFEKNRIGLAKWITDKDNPLTARVTVNRYWQHLFGTGIVKTAEDFGNQGELPSHPKLLDWLAIEFMESGWDVKALHKLMVMSNTYQQNSIASSELLELDGENRLLARGPSKRLSGEMLRDNALYASGLLNEKIGGESVYPYQPPGLWRVTGDEYAQGQGEELYRRSIYTIWKRAVPHPTISTFDVPSRDLCTTRRQETNTPLQALVLLNDPTFVEAARVLGKKMMEYDSISQGIAKTYKKLTGRTIKKEELTILTELQHTEFEKFKNNKAKAQGWISIGEYAIAPTDDIALVAANAVVASTIINSDAFITKR